MIVYGLDPGVRFGFARYSSGKLDELFTLSMVDAFKFVYGLNGEYLLVMEDSRVITKNFRDKPDDTKAVAFSKGRSLGRVDCCCTVIEDICHKKGIPLIGISAKDKGVKIEAEPFNRITGWTKQSNSHTRDAAMVAWMYRHKR